MSPRPLRASLVAFLLILGACTTVAPTGTTPEPIPETTRAPDETTTSTTASLSGDDPARSALLAEIERLQEVTEEVRGLPFLEPPRVTVLSTAELAERVRELIDEELDPEELEVDQAVMRLLGLLEPGTDLRRLYLDLYAEQVAGFYDGDTGELVVPARPEGLSPLNRVTLVHELVHSVTDQHFAFHDHFVRLDEEERYDEASAFQALIEGDATFYQLVYLQEHVPRDEQIEVAMEALDQESEVFDRAPRFLRDLLIFPYDTGTTLVTELVRRSGTEAVDDGYLDPPTTTEQVIHPEKYFDREGPRPVALPDTPLAGYEVAEESVWGELGFRVMLAHALGIGEAAPAAAGWGGDRYRILWNGDEVAMALRYLGDTPADAADLSEALIRYVRAAMAVESEQAVGVGIALSGPSAYAFVARTADEVLFLIASDPAAGETLRALLD